MHPATRILMKLGPSVEDADNWRFVVCVLKLLVDIDPRPQLQPNPVEDVYARMREAGISDNAPSFIIFRERLSGIYEQFASC